MAGASTRHQAGDGPYGTIDGRPPERTACCCPRGSAARRLAVAGEPVGDTDYRWHVFPDGAATFDDGDGGWFYVCNSEVFAPTAPAAPAPSTSTPTARSSTPTGCSTARRPTARAGRPHGARGSRARRGSTASARCGRSTRPARRRGARPALGRWAHEAVAVDPDDEVLYLTEDNPGGKLYRFTPEAYPDLAAGRLDAAVVAADGAVTWAPVADPSAATAPTQRPGPAATTFPGNEGIWYHDRTIVFTSRRATTASTPSISTPRCTRLLWDGTSSDP